MRAWLSVLLLLLALPASAAEGKRVALVAGNSAYQFVPVLPNPSKDATAVAKALAAVGFDVTLATDRTTASLKIDVDNFIKEVEEAGPGATAVVYYAGHGVQLDGTNYILPVDAKLGKDLEATKEAVSLSDILKRLDATGATTKIVILDACRDNPFTGAWAPGLAMVENRGAGKGENGLARVESKGGTLVSFATAPGATASDGAGDHSPYTTAFLKMMQEPGVPAEQVFKRVRVAVYDATSGAQTPWETSSLTTNFMFVPAKGGQAIGSAIEQEAYAGKLKPTRAAFLAVAFEEAIRVALIWDTPDVYRIFLDAWGADPRSVAIHRGLSLRQMETAWLFAVTEGTREAYDAFFALYPGAHADELRRLTVAAPRRGDLKTASICVPERNSPKLPLGNQPPQKRTELPPQQPLNQPPVEIVPERPVQVIPERPIRVVIPERPIKVIPDRPIKVDPVPDRPKVDPVPPGRGETGPGKPPKRPGVTIGTRPTFDPNLVRTPKRFVDQTSSIPKRVITNPGLSRGSFQPNGVSAQRLQSVQRFQPVQRFQGMSMGRASSFGGGRGFGGRLR